MNRNSTLMDAFKTFLLAIAFSIYPFFISHAQVTDPSTYDLRFANQTIDCGVTPNIFCADISIKASTGAPDFAIGSHTIFFTYNKSSLTNPIYTSLQFNTATECEIAPGTNYNPYGSLNFGFSEVGAMGEANFTTLLNFFVPGAECPVVSSDWIIMGTVCFEVLDAGIETNLLFDNTLTDINRSDNTPQHIQGTFTNLNILPDCPAPCLADAGTPTVSDVYVCWDGMVNFSVADYTLGNDTEGYVGLAVSPNSNETDILTATFFSLDASDNETHTNDGTAYPLNTELYLYSFIGEGTPFSLDPDCTDFSEGVGPFVLLQNIAVNAGGTLNYICNNDGTADVDISPSGGLPAYDAAELYTVSVTGATYTGAAQIGAAESITITVNDGVLWEVTFTDGLGCSGGFDDVFVEAGNCEPEPCDAVAGTTAVSATLVCWEDDFTLSASGYILGDAADGYIAMGVSANSNETDATSATFFSLDVGDNALHTNDGTQYPINTDLYVYSFIGEGTPFNINLDCTDFSAATGPFVLLQNIAVNAGGTLSYICNNDGTADLDLTPDGGLPAYDNGEQYTVTVAGATYTGASTVSVGETITITTTDGLPWEVIFTDTHGCSETLGGTFVEAGNCDVTCLADAGTPTFSTDYICFGEDVQIAVGGFVLGDETEGYVALGVSPNNDETDPTTATYFSLDPATSAIHTNNGTEYPLNTDLYLYSFIGQGDPFSINLTCTDLSQAVGPFVMLNELRINGGGNFSYTCNGDNTANVELNVTGGLPAYDAAEQFTVVVDNATYTGASNIADGANISILVADGADWSVSFTDTEGCTASIGSTFDASVSCETSVTVLTVVSNTTDVACGNNDGQICLRISDGTAPYTVTIGTSTYGPFDEGIEDCIESLPMGTYTLNIADVDGNTATETAIINEGNSNITVNATNIIDASCTGADGQICLRITDGTAPYTVSNGAIVLGTFDEGVEDCLNNLAAGNYDLSIQDAAGCSQNETFTVGQASNNITVNATNIIAASCTGADGQICLRITDGTAPYTVSDGATVLGTFDEGVEDCITGLAAGNYDLSIQDAAGCSQNETFTVGQASNNITINATNIIDASCAGADGQICLRITDGTAPYTVSNGATVLGTFDEGVEDCITGLAAGNYDLSIQDAAGCSQNETFTVGQASNNITVNATNIIDASCAGADGQICLRITDGTAPYTVSDGATVLGTFDEGVEDCLNNLAAGNYDLSIQDAAGCSQNETFTVGQASNNITVNETNIIDASCAGADGQICLQISGGTAPYFVTDGTSDLGVFDESIESCIANLAGGTYNLTITDNGGCETTTSITVDQADNSITVAVNSVSDATCGAENGQICLQIANGNAPYTVTSSGAQLALLEENVATCLDDLAADTYNLLIFDNAGCAVQEMVTVGQIDSDITVAVNSVSDASCAGNDGAFCLQIANGVAPYQVSEGGNPLGNFDENIEDCIGELGAGTYDLTIKDAAGCVFNQTITIEQITANEITLTTEVTSATCSGSNGEMCLIVTGGTAPYTIDDGTVTLGVFNESDEQCFDGFESGVYNLNITDLNGCTTTETVLVADVNNVFTFETEITHETCLGNDGQICLLIFGEAQPYQVTLADGTDYGMFDNAVQKCLNGFTAGTYTFTVTDTEGCSEDVTATVNAPEADCSNLDECSNNFATCTAMETAVMICPDYCDFENFTLPIVEANHAAELTVLPNNCVSYLPEIGFTGLDTVSLTACDMETGKCDIAFIFVLVGECNQPPVATADVQTTGENTTVCINVTANDFDVDGDDFVIDNFTQAANGTVILDAETGALCYTPNAGFSGADSFDYTVCDDDGCSTATVSIQVNDADCENPDNLCTEQFTPIEFCVQFCDLDATATIQALHTSFDCGLVILPNNCVEYNPLPAFTGTDVIQVVGCTDAGVCDTVFVSITVGVCTDVHPPVANNDFAATTENTPVSIIVLNNDTDQDGDPFSITTFTQGSNGTVAFNDDGTELIYTPNTGFSGTDVFTYTICDEDGCDDATVTVTVLEGSNNNPPVAVNDTGETATETPVTIFVLENDSDPDGDPFNITSFSQGSNGTVALNADMTALIYTPNAGFEGTDVFTYQICDDDGCDMATVTIEVIDCSIPEGLCTAPQTPIEICVEFCDLEGDIGIEAVHTTFDCGLEVTGINCVTYTPLPGWFGTDTVQIIACNTLGECDTVVVNLFVGDCEENTPPVANDDIALTDEDVPVTIFVLNNDTETDGDPFTINTFSQGSNGTVSFNAAINALVYTPNIGFVGTDVFTYEICDDDGCDEATVTVTIQEIGTPPLAVDDNATTEQDISVTIFVLENDAETEEDPFNITSFSQGSNGTVALNADMTALVYTPNSGFSGTDVFTYQICDDDGCDMAMVTVEVMSPCVNPNDLCTAPQTPVEFCVEFCDLEGIVTIQSVHTTFDCGLEVDGDCVTYTPLPGWFGLDTVQVIGCNDLGECDTIVVNIFVGDCTGMNPPIAMDDNVTIEQNTNISIAVLENDTEPDGEPFNISTFTQPTNGTVTQVGNELVYTPNAGYLGIDIFTYTICDDDGCDEATVTINVIPMCVDPDSVCTDVGSMIQVCFNFCDLDGSNIAITNAIATTGSGIVQMVGDDCIQFAPQPGFMGNEIVEVTACDETGACATLNLNVQVGDCGENFPPEAINDFVFTDLDIAVVISPLENDSDPNSDPLTISTFTQPMNGTAVLNADGESFTYTPNAGFVGVDSFMYQICDDEGLCDNAVIYVAIVSDCDETQYVCAEPIVPVIICVEFCAFSETDTVEIVDANTTFNCSINLLGDGCLQYVALPGYQGIDSITIVGCNTLGVCDTTMAYAYIGCSPPIAVDDYASIATTETASVPVLDNDIHPCPEEMVALITTPPSNGVAVADANGNINYQPNPGFIGMDTIVYQACNICEGVEYCDEALVIITVTEEVIPEDLMANADIVQTPFNTPIEINVLGNDTGEGIVITTFTDPENGTVMFNADSTALIYTPDPGYEGADFFFYTICDENGDCDQTIVGIEVLPNMSPNLPPTANDDFAETILDLPVIIGVLSNDSDPEGGELTISILDEPGTGTVSINPDGTITYTPNPGFLGTDTFTYVICDPLGLCDTAIVGVSVGSDFPNNPPIGQNDLGETSIDIPVTINVLANDFEPDGDPVVISIGVPPAHGTIVINGDSTFLYTPDPGYEGVDYFLYILCDDGMPALCDTAYVFIEVGDANNPPIAENDTVITLVNELIDIPVLDNDSDPNGDPISITNIVIPPMNGNAIISIDGTTIGYLPNLDFVGLDSFVYVICDPDGACDEATVYITIHPAIDAEPDIDFTTENTPVEIDILANDTGFELDITEFTQGENGTVMYNADSTALIYTPNPGFLGEDYFFYTICDGFGNCDSTIVAITVLGSDGENNPPTANNDVATTPIDTPVSIPVLVNDTDPDGDPLTITDIIDIPADGTVIIDGDMIVFTPNEGFIGCVEFGYIVCDDGMPALCDTAYVGVMVGTDTCLNIPPIAVDDFTETPMETPIVISVLSNDSDPDGDDANLVVTVATQPMNGTATLNLDGTVTYLPELGFYGVDYFTYIICDEGLPVLCDTAYVEITVLPADLDAEPDIVYTAIDTPIEIDVLANDEGVGLTISDIVSGPDNGSVVINAGQTVTYTPDPGFVGTDYFEYEVCDELGNCETTLVTVIVLPDTMTNIPPNAVNDMATTPVNTPVDINQLLNDNDPYGGDTLFVTNFTQPANGLVILNPDQTFTYTPNLDFVGIDTFSYTICDNGVPVLCDTATVVVNVGSTEPTNNPPLAVDDADFTNENVPIVISILFNDSDPDGDNLIVTWVSEPLNGMTTLNPDGTVTYTPDSSFVGMDFFSYIICDDGLPVLCDTAYVTITVVEDMLPVPDIMLTIPEDTDTLICIDEFIPLDFPIADLTILVPPMNGVATPSLTSDSCFVYSPNMDYVGLDALMVVICDDMGECDTINVFIDITPVPDPPVAVDDVETTDFNTPIIIDILANDFDVDGDDLMVLGIIESPTNGMAVLEMDGTVTYTPDSGFVGKDSFVYVITDPTGLTDTANVCVFVGDSIIEPPVDTSLLIVAVDDLGMTDINTPMLIEVLLNDTIPALADTLTVDIIEDPQNGTATVNVSPDGEITVTYLPMTDFVGIDTFTYVLCAEVFELDTIVCDTALVIITIEGEDPPVDCELMFMNGFSPNGDNINDFFIIGNLENFDECYPETTPDLLIFNRWGDKVYQNERYSNDDPWDGTFQKTGEDVPPATYFYLLWFEIDGEKVDHQGYVEILR